MLEERAYLSTVLGSISLGNRVAVGQIAINPGSEQVYVASGFGSGTLQVVNASAPASPTIVTTIAQGSGVVVNPLTNRFYTADGNGDVLVYDGASNSLLATIHIGYIPGALAIDTSRNLIYVTCQGGSSNDPLFVLNGATNAIVAGPLGSGGVNASPYVNPATGHFYDDRSDGTTREYDPSNAFVADLAWTVVAVNPVTNCLYDSSTSTGTALQVRDGSSEAVLATIPGAAVGSVGVNTSLDRLYVTDSAHNAIDVIDGATNKTTGTISLGAGVSPYAITVDSVNNRIYVAASVSGGTTKLYVIADGPTVVDPNLAGTWNINGSPTRIQQTGSSLVFTNQYNQTSAGYFINPSQVLATSWGNLVGTLSGNSGQYTIQWSDGTAWLQGPVEVRTGLVGLWQGDGNTTDSSGAGHNGKIQGGVSYVPGITGQAFSFNGVNGSVLVPDTPSLDFTSQFTLSAWVDPRTLVSGDIISKVGTATGNKGYEFYLTDNNTQLVLQFNGQGEAWASDVLTVTLPAAIPIGQWTYVAATYDQSQISIYVNGNLAGSEVIGPKTLATSTANFRIGGNDNGDRPFAGLIADVAVYNRALSVTEIAGNMSAPLPTIITVTTLADQLNAGNGLVSLRDAIQASEKRTSVDGSVAGTGNDVIQFAPGLSGTIDLSIVGDKSFGPSAFLISNDILTIQGPTSGSGITIQRDPQAPAFRLFNVAVGASLTLANLTLSGGLAQGANGTAGSGGGGGGGGLGGAIFDRGNVTLVEQHAREQPGHRRQWREFCRWKCHDGRHGRRPGR